MIIRQYLHPFKTSSLILIKYTIKNGLSHKIISKTLQLSQNSRIPVFCEPPLFQHGKNHAGEERDKPYDPYDDAKLVEIL